ncbi:winged helix-turn-helix transcriptional regulator [Sphingobacterium arenae]|uniref:Helix-turn-helix transcriptional regulator n=1 Tax=Sphingobacterium arenae TaxID=1280598 RepID=A0ABR7Y2P8_9SPHI|nr:helix-turn-helix domain-containing protein [Sphingobacterium arenae]MBD1425573.1 helix-turn-helix transcriptional regulator [Sphingobacterium arenae]
MENKIENIPCERQDHASCDKHIAAVHDTMDVLHGKWKITIISLLGFGKRRYSEILKEVKGISGKMLSRELKDMEMNLLVKRTVISEQPISVVYELTDYCIELLPVINSLAAWGTRHRQCIVEQFKQERQDIPA